jgi:membrane-associated phospholipid phosphatase
MKFNKIFQEKYRLFLFLHISLLIILFPVFINFSKAEIHLTINQFHDAFTDIFFKYITFLGDGLTPVLIGLYFAVFSFRKAMLIIVSGSFAGLMAQFFKRLIFYDIDRPVKYLANFNLHLVDGVQMYTSHSFPSGHSATIFAFCLVLSTFTISTLNKIVLFCAAVLVAFSRVYLSQHFLIDTYAGSIIGTTCAIIVIYFINKQKADWLDNSFLQIYKKYHRQ